MSYQNFLFRTCNVSLSPWFRYVRVSSCSLTAGDVAAHSTYWNGGFLVSLSGGRLVSSCLKIGRASTSLGETRKKDRSNISIWVMKGEKNNKTNKQNNNRRQRNIVKEELWRLKVDFGAFVLLLASLIESHVATAIITMTLKTNPALIPQA